MFSQLCRARPRTLWNKFGQQTVEAYASPGSDGEDRCQLEHCAFCDYRVCCQASPSTQYNWDAESLSCPDTVTENPAYGLSSKNWLETEQDDAVDMESSENGAKHDESLIPNFPLGNTASQEDCDANEMSSRVNFQPNRMELKTRHPEEAYDASKQETHCNDPKHGKLCWSVLRHRQLSGDILKNCDNKPNSVVIEHSSSDKNGDSQDPKATKRSTKDRSFPLSLMRPTAKTEAASQQHFNHFCLKNDLSRQKPVQRVARDKYQHSKDADSSKRLASDILDLSNPLSDIATIRTEESIQEWLARIGESATSTWPEDLELKEESSAWSLLNNTDEEKGRSNSNSRHVLRHRRTGSDNTLPKRTAEVDRCRENPLCYEEHAQKTEQDTSSVLCGASKSSPANVPMVVMQCSRLHSHIGCKPPFQQTSLPMGTLVTALYQESEWLYVQTPHGVEGFVSSSDCVPIGTVHERNHASRRPWEPCDFPIQVKKSEFGRQQNSSYIPAQLPTSSSGKQAPPYVSTVKMKTSFYSDRYFSHTFKSKDSIKTAKTVTDILRSSPETKVSNQ